LILSKKVGEWTHQRYSADGRNNPSLARQLWSLAEDLEASIETGIPPSWSAPTKYLSDNVVTDKDLFRLAATNQNTFRDFAAGKTVIVEGKGPRASVAIEWLLGLGPSEAYGDDGAQPSVARKIYWIGPRPEGPQYQELLRYSALRGHAGAVAASVELVPDRLSHELARLPDGRYLLSTGEQQGVATGDSIVDATADPDATEEFWSRLNIGNNQAMIDVLEGMTRDTNSGGAQRTEQILGRDSVPGGENGDAE
jgi:hypothetical protein